ncbi:MAG: endolytic transglycosylase MltG, partial [Acidobacteriota bacterium]
RREMERTELIADLDPDATRLEGYLYPDTYHFARGTSEAEVVSTLVRTFRSRFERDVAPLLSGSDLGVRGVVTLASIVEKETQRDDERTLVASVYANRLRIGMGLYADPTIIYAKKLAGTWDGNLRRPDLKLDSPYNTYVVPGLPPGPICSPTVASMVAALRPADSEYLYFVSRNDGTHVFSRTLAEHNRNVYVWQKKYWRDRWAREGRSSGG